MAIEQMRDGNLHSNVMANVPVPTKSVEAANWRSFDQTVGRVRKAFADLRADELKRLLDEAVASVRRGKHRERNEPDNVRR